MARSGGADLTGSARLHLVAGAALLYPDEQLFDAMVDGWRAQQTSRYLSPLTLRQREGQLRRFQRWTNEYPWSWGPADVEEWTTGALSERHLAHSTVSNFHRTIRLFMDFVCDARYGWVDECERRFGTHPVQICHEWNTVAHLAENEGRPGNRPLLARRAPGALRSCRRPCGRDPLEGEERLARGVPGRDDFQGCLRLGTPPPGGRPPRAVRPGSQSEGAGVRRAGSADGPVGKGVARCATETPAGTHRHAVGGGRSSSSISTRSVLSTTLSTKGSGRPSGAGSSRQRTSTWSSHGFVTRSGSPAELGPHCLRHSYVTHLLEDGWDPLFVQQQVGHVWASTTAIYTGVSSAYKNHVLRRKLDELLQRKEVP